MADNSTSTSGRFRHTGLFVLASVVWLLAGTVASFFLYDKSWDTTAYYLFSLVFELSLFLPAAVFLVVKRISLPALFGRAHADQVISSAFLGMLIVPVSIALTAAWTFLVLLTGGRLPQEGAPAPETAVQYLAAFAVLGLAAPLVEEPMMRGITLGGQAGVLGRNRAVFCTGLVFAMMHGQFIGLPALLLGGVVLTALAWHSGSLWPPIAFHFTYNSMTIVAEALRGAILNKYDQQAATVTAVTPEFLVQFIFGAIIWILIALPFATASGAVLWGFWQFTPKALRPKPDNARLSFRILWPWLVAVFLLLLYIVIDVLQIYGIINLLRY